MLYTSSIIISSITLSLSIYIHVLCNVFFFGLADQYPYSLGIHVIQIVFVIIKFNCT